jgi:hypothetical protein
MVRLMISRSPDREQIINTPRAHDCRNQEGVQGWFADEDVIDYGEPLRLLNRCIWLGARWCYQHQRVSLDIDSARTGPKLR